MQSELVVLDRDTWNYIIVYKLFVSDLNIWNHMTVNYLHFDLLVAAMIVYNYHISYLKPYNCWQKRILVLNNPRSVWDINLTNQSVDCFVLGQHKPRKKNGSTQVMKSKKKEEVFISPWKKNLSIKPNEKRMGLHKSLKKKRMGLYKSLKIRMGLYKSLKRKRIGLYKSLKKQKRIGPYKSLKKTSIYKSLKKKNGSAQVIEKVKKNASKKVYLGTSHQGKKRVSLTFQMTCID